MPGQQVAGSPTGAAVPLDGFYVGLLGASGNLEGAQAVRQTADGATGNGVISQQPYAYNGTNYDRQRNNESVTLLASAARTTTQTSADLVNYNGASYIDVILDMTVVGTGSVTLTINGKDPASAKYYNILTGAAVVTNVTNVYRVGIGRTAAANATVNDTLPRTFQIVVTANNANSVTYSVGYNLTRG